MTVRRNQHIQHRRPMVMAALAVLMALAGCNGDRPPDDGRATASPADPLPARQADPLPASPADLVLRGGRIATVDPDLGEAQAIQ